MSQFPEQHQSAAGRPGNIDQLIVGYLEDLSTDEELQEFYQLLSADESARETFSEQAALHGVLAWLHQQSDLPRSEQEPNQLSETRIANATSFSKWLPPLMLAASIAIVSAALLITRNTEPQTNQPHDNTIANTSPSEEGSVARIVRKVDCDWEGDRWSIVASSRLFPGQTLALSRGLMEIEFSSGARLTLEAPVSFTVESAMRGALQHGKLTAQVPESAHGFTIDTPRGEMIDLGTEFGLDVEVDGTTETHVFKGEVVVHPDGAENESADVHLTEAMAVRLGAREDNPSSLAAVPGRFTRLVFDEEDPVDPPVVDRHLSLWYDAAHRLQKDEAGRVAAWGDLHTESNDTEQNAWQVEKNRRPEWIAKAIGTKPAVRFDRKNRLITEPLKLGSAQSVAVVFRLNTNLMKKWGIGSHGRQLLNLNGPPHLSLRIDKQMRLVSRCHTGAVKKPTAKNQYGNVGRTMSPQALENKPVVAVSIYDPPSNSSRLYLNGVLVGKAKAPELDATNSPRYIGSHMFLPNTHFFGDLSELMIYDTGLTEKEVVSLSRFLMKKYAIEVSAPLSSGHVSQTGI